MGEHGAIQTPAPKEGQSGRLVALRVAQVGLIFISTIIVARQLGPLGRAQYALPLAAAGVAGGLAHLSLGDAAVRLLARKEADLVELNQHLVAAMLCLSGLAAAATAGYCLAAPNGVAHASTATVALAAATVPCVLIGQVSGSLLIVIGATAAWAWATVIGVAIQLVGLGVWISVTRLDPASAMALAFVGFFATAVTILVTMARRAGLAVLRPRWTRALGAQLTKVAVALHPGTLALQLGTRIDLLIVGLLVSRRSVGLYSLALTLASSAYLVTQTLSLGALHRQMEDELRSALRFTAVFTRQVIAVALVTCAVVAGIAYPFITIIYGSVWAGSVVPFIILLIAAIAMAPEEPVRRMLWRTGPPWLLSAVACGGVFLNAVATVALVQPMGIAGAALGSVAAFWVYAAVMVAILIRTSELTARELISLPHRGDPLSEVIGTVVRRFRVRPRAIDS